MSADARASGSVVLLFTVPDVEGRRPLAGAGGRGAGGGGQHRARRLSRGGVDGPPDEGLGQRELWSSSLGPWALRAAGLVLVGAAVSVLGGRVSPWLPLALAPFLGVLYLWVMRPLYADLPLPARVRPWLARLRLVPA